MMRIILITGISGSGKSVALNALADIGYYCVDNLPPHFLPELAHFLARDGYAQLAVAIDARSANSLANLPDIVHRLHDSYHYQVNVLFLNASTQALIQRFSETRRRHPLSVTAIGHEQASLADAIERERELMTGLTLLGHQIDTSHLRANALRTWVKQFIKHQPIDLTLMFESFGFKHGIPLDADFVFDTRVLPNPHYDHRLQSLTGLDQPVADFLAAIPEVHAMISDIAAFLRKWLPYFRQDNRSYLTVALGCTGGQHRSVYVAETLGACLSNEADILIRHREIIG